MSATVQASDRCSEFTTIVDSLGSAVVDETATSVVALGDSIDLLRAMPDKCVSLILCDPPYHSTHKSNIRGDRAFTEDADFLEWMRSYAVEWQRVLKHSGTVYVFCSSRMSSRLDVAISDYFLPVSSITWTKPNKPGFDGWKGKMSKESLRQWYPHSERILVFEQGAYGDHMATRQTPLSVYLKQCRKTAGMTAKDLTGAIGAHGKVNHGGAVSNWETGRNIPNRSQYERMAQVLEGTGNIPAMLPYNDIVRPMYLSRDVEFTDVWTFPSVRPYKGKHPAEKPVDMLAHIIDASSYPGDIVLDCFAGSGSTGVASVMEGRRAICMDVEEAWAKRSAQRITETLVGGNSQGALPFKVDSSPGCSEHPASR